MSSVERAAAGPAASLADVVEVTRRCAPARARRASRSRAAAGPALRRRPARVDDPRGDRNEPGRPLGVPRPVSCSANDGVGGDEQHATRRVTQPGITGPVHAYACRSMHDRRHPALAGRLGAARLRGAAQRRRRPAHHRRRRALRPPRSSTAASGCCAAPGTRRGHSALACRRRAAVRRRRVHRPRTPPPPRPRSRWTSPRRPDPTRRARRIDRAAVLDLDRLAFDSFWRSTLHGLERRDPGDAVARFRVLGPRRTAERTSGYAITGRAGPHGLPAAGRGRTRRPAPAASGHASSSTGCSGSPPRARPRRS